MTTTNDPASYSYRATFARLDSGDWGARVTADRAADLPAVGDVAVILRRSGSGVPKRLTAHAGGWKPAPGGRGVVALYEIDDPANGEPAAPPARDTAAGVDAWTRGALASLRQRAERAEEHAAALAARLTALEALVTARLDGHDAALASLNRSALRAAVEAIPYAPAEEPVEPPSQLEDVPPAPAIPSLADHGYAPDPDGGVRTRPLTAEELAQFDDEDRARIEGVRALLALARAGVFALLALVLVACSGVHVPADAGPAPDDAAAPGFAADTACELVFQRTPEVCPPAPCPYPAGTLCDFTAVMECLAALDTARECGRFAATLETCAANGGCL